VDFEIAWVHHRFHEYKPDIKRMALQRPSRGMSMHRYPSRLEGLGLKQRPWKEHFTMAARHSPLPPGQGSAGAGGINRRSVTVKRCLIPPAPARHACKCASTGTMWTNGSGAEMF